MPALPIGGREREILTAIVETFIATGEPVGSRTLSRLNREGLSPASIRNVMADLSDAGLLEQPHTSAGRVPTPEAYRYYVEQLTGEAHLSHENQAIIEDAFHGISDAQEFMERTSHVLSLVSRNVGVAVATAGPKNALEHVYFSRLADQKVLAVVITRSGLVRDRVLRLEISQADLDVAARYINDNFRGWTMESMHAEIARRLEQEGVSPAQAERGASARAGAQRVRPHHEFYRTALQPGCPPGGTTCSDRVCGGRIQSGCK